MAVIGILTCEILELEFARLLANDPAVDQVTVICDSHAERFLQCMERAHFHHLYQIPHIHAFQHHPCKKVEVLVRILEFALHNRKKTLQQAVIQAAREMRPHVDALVLGYGRCGGAFDNPADIIESRTPVFFPEDDTQLPDEPFDPAAADHCLVDDCVGLLLGGRVNYYTEQCRIPGTFFMIPGWVHHWQRIFDQDFCGRDPEMARRLFEHYERSLLVLTPVMSEATMRQKTEAFNTFFNTRVETRQGTLRLLTHTWKSALAWVQEIQNKNKDAE